MTEELDPVSEVREWRRKMVERWKGKSREEIRRELQELGDTFRREQKEARNQRNEEAA